MARGVKMSQIKFGTRRVDTTGATLSHAPEVSDLWALMKKARTSHGQFHALAWVLGSRCFILSARAAHYSQSVQWRLQASDDRTSGLVWILDTNDVLLIHNLVYQDSLLVPSQDIAAAVVSEAGKHKRIHNSSYHTYLGLRPAVPVGPRGLKS
jgi:hypothetical protein